MTGADAPLAIVCRNPNPGVRHVKPGGIRPGGPGAGAVRPDGHLAFAGRCQRLGPAAAHPVLKADRHDILLRVVHVVSDLHHTAAERLVGGHVRDGRRHIEQFAAARVWHRRQPNHDQTDQPHHQEAFKRHLPYATANQSVVVAYPDHPVNATIMPIPSWGI